ncbi:hypothetical protein N7451_003940 [Penicillium sp. IBT 35674x]|nr:hypothetical protein N7451_003940 [Penicillium sp. IBT 35674x]
MSSKQDNQRFSNIADINPGTQKQSSTGRMATAKTGQQKKQDDLGPTQLLAEHMNSEGNPVPDSPAGKQSKDDVDVYEAMTKDFD